QISAHGLPSSAPLGNGVIPSQNDCFHSLSPQDLFSSTRPHLALVLIPRLTAPSIQNISGHYLASVPASSPVKLPLGSSFKCLPSTKEKPAEMINPSPSVSPKVPNMKSGTGSPMRLRTASKPMPTSVSTMPSCRLPITRDTSPPIWGDDSGFSGKDADSRKRLPVSERT